MSKLYTIKIGENKYRKVGSDVFNFIEKLSQDKETLEEEIERLNNIIKEAREYIEHAQNYEKEKILYINGNNILEILDKVEENK